MDMLGLYTECFMSVFGTSMSSVGILGIVGTETKLGMLGIARYAMIRTISSAVSH
jgi:hypothetical protein